jgi:hypothetical protein
MWRKRPARTLALLGGKSHHGSLAFACASSDFSELSVPRVRVVHGCHFDLLIAVLDPAVQVHLLQYRAESVTARRIPRVAAEVLHSILLERFTGVAWVFDVEYGFFGVNESVEGAAFAVFDALLVDGELDDWKDVWDNVAGIFEAEGHVQGMRLVGDVVEEVDRVLFGEVKAVLILLTGGQ